MMNDAHPNRFAERETYRTTRLDQNIQQRRQRRPIRGCASKDRLLNRRPAIYPL